MTKISQKPEPRSLDNAKPLLVERAELYEQKQAIDERIKTLDKDLRPMLEGLGPVVYRGWQYEVAMTAGRITYDYKTMETDGVRIENYAKVGAPSTRFTIKKVQEV